MHPLPAARPTLMLVTDRHRVGGLAPLLDAIVWAVAAGVDIVQVREKDLPSIMLRPFLEKVSAAVGDGAAVVVNADVQTALDLGLGVHLPEMAPPLTAGEISRLPPVAMVGRSIHGSPPERQERLSYAIYGHVFPSGSKPGVPGRGLNLLQDVASQSTHPILAIGGITAENAGAALGHGAAGVAVIGAILDAPNIDGATRNLRAAIDRATAQCGGHE